MTRRNRTAANQLRKLDQQRAAEGHQKRVVLFERYPDMAARELPELEEPVPADTESGHSPAAAQQDMAVLVTDTAIRLADAATLDPVTGRLDRPADEAVFLARLEGRRGTERIPPMVPCEPLNKRMDANERSADGPS